MSETRLDGNDLQQDMALGNPEGNSSELLVPSFMLISDFNYSTKAVQS